MRGFRARRAPAAALLAALLALPLLAEQAPVAIPGAPPPHLLAQEPVWDAGTVASGVVILHDFLVRNDGTDTIFLREVRPSCGCTVVSFDPSIAPGGSGRVRAQVDTGAFRGGIAKDVTVFSSDPGNPALQLTIKAVVRPAVDALPGYIRFRHVQGQPDETVTQLVWSTDKADFAITGARSPLPQLAISMRPATAAERQPHGTDRQWVVAATLKSEAPVGPLEGDVVLTTNDPRQTTLSLPLAGDVRPLVALTPPVVDFGSFSAGEPRRASFLVTNNGPAPVQVLGVDTDVHGLTAKLQPRDGGKKWDVVLTVAPDAPKGKLQGTVRVRTSAPQEPLVEARILGTVR